MINKKLVVVGDGFCGKTALLFAFTQDKFEDGYEPTVFETMCVHVEVDRRSLATAWHKVSEKINLSLWDTAGQDDYDRLRPLSYPDTDVVVMCYSVDNGASFTNIRTKWVPELKHFCCGVPFLLVANKLDLRQEAYGSKGPSLGSSPPTTPNPSSGTPSPDVTASKPPLGIKETPSVPPMVTWEEGQSMAQEIGAFAFFECSAKTRDHVKDVFVMAVRASLKGRKQQGKQCKIL